MSFRRIIGIIVYGLGLATLVLTQTESPAFNGHITEDPTQLLGKYLSLDKKGARLEAYSTEVLKPFVAWREEPVWGKVVIISDYQIIEDVAKWQILSAMEAKVPVVFNVLGTMHWESVTFVPEAHQEFQYFHIKAVHDRWQIMAPQLPPHVGRQRMVDFVRWADLHETNIEKKARFAHLKSQLEAQKG
ncbi:MAG: hypothetical protein KC563_03580 [Nitrospira sp.]|nr:hypothetical protein [Nitrospira sp.]MCA9474879.1 hypothetical protein [Nitrospira sp.]MCA9479319.1 hypothetical protein [Nitrospira sp.]MCB9711742.1 hypothetical protein [Nitrospiraceae bacterium]MDR4488672.1 hypothetical protein [Nitrospirales bacterium]